MAPPTALLLAKMWRSKKLPTVFLKYARRELKLAGVLVVLHRRYESTVEQLHEKFTFEHESQQ